MDDVHPIRVWRVDEPFRTNLDLTRQILKKSQKKYPRVGGIQVVENHLGLNRTTIDSFERLQADLYKREESTRFLFSFLEFWDRHRQVFEFDSKLSEALAFTDIDDVPWSELRFPHEEFYISLGDYGQRSFVIGDFEYIIDGAYIRHVNQASSLFPNDTLLMHFTSRLLQPSYHEAKRLRKSTGYHYAEPIYDYCISGKGCTTIGEAIARGESEYFAHCDRLDNNVLETARELAPEFRVPPFGERLQFNRQKFERGRQIIADAVPPLFNAIFYLTAQPEHRETRFPKQAPTLLVNALKTEQSESQRKTYQSLLAQKGFSAITFVRDPELVFDDSPSERTGRHVRSHWRRGHYRHQPYGEKMSQRRWLWIKPVLVKPAEPFTLGAIHDVKSEQPAE